MALAGQFTSASPSWELQRQWEKHFAGPPRVPSPQHLEDFLKFDRAKCGEDVAQVAQLVRHFGGRFYDPKFSGTEDIQKIYAKLDSLKGSEDCFKAAAATYTVLSID